MGNAILMQVRAKRVGEVIQAGFMRQQESGLAGVRQPTEGDWMRREDGQKRRATVSLMIEGTLGKGDISLGLV